jgi:hypothetical protein
VAEGPKDDDGQIVVRATVVPRSGKVNGMSVSRLNAIVEAAREAKNPLLVSS